MTTDIPVQDAGRGDKIALAVNMAGSRAVAHADGDSGSLGTMYPASPTWPTRRIPAIWIEKLIVRIHRSP